MQMTLRLPEDLARRLAACTPSRKRNQFLVDLLRRELDGENRELEEAAIRLTSLEAVHRAKDPDWLALEEDEADWGEFDEQCFVDELRAQSHDTSDAAPTVKA